MTRKYIIRWYSYINRESYFIKKNSGTTSMLSYAGTFDNADDAEYRMGLLSEDKFFKKGHFYISKVFCKKYGIREYPVKLTKYDKYDFISKL